MNNFLSYNNEVGVFADLTTKDNLINRAQVYNNSQYGLYFKNSSGNILNDLRIFSNGIGIKAASNSVNNLFHGELYLFDNTENLTGTDGNDTQLHR